MDLFEELRKLGVAGEPATTMATCEEGGLLDCIGQPIAIDPWPPV